MRSLAAVLLWLLAVSAPAQTLLDDLAATETPTEEAAALNLTLDDEAWLQQAATTLLAAGVPQEMDSLRAYVLRVGILIDPDELPRVALGDAARQALRRDPELWNSQFGRKPSRFALIRTGWDGAGNETLGRIHFRQNKIAGKLSLRNSDQPVSGALQLQLARSWQLVTGQFLWQRGQGLYTSPLAQRRLGLSPLALFSLPLPELLLYDGQSPDLALSGMAATYAGKRATYMGWVGAAGSSTNARPAAGASARFTLAPAWEATVSAEVTNPTTSPSTSGVAHVRYQSGGTQLHAEAVVAQARAASLAWLQQLSARWQLFATIGGVEGVLSNAETRAHQLAPLREVALLGAAYWHNRYWQGEIWYEADRDRWSARVTYTPSRRLSVWSRYQLGDEWRTVCQWTPTRQSALRTTVVIKSGYLVHLQPWRQLSLRWEGGAGLALFDLSTTRILLPERTLTTDVQLSGFQGKGSALFALLSYRILPDVRLQMRAQWQTVETAVLASNKWSLRVQTFFRF